MLLDTEVWLWLLSEPERVRAKSLYALEDPQNDRFVSLVSYWEISIKNGLGKLPLPLPLEEFLPARLEAVSGYLLGISPAHVIAVAALPHIHRDPFDRLLISQAKAEGLSLVTADTDIARYDVDVLWANRRKRQPARETSP